MSYEPELDESTRLDPDAASYFQSIIGVLRWMVELGRIDIATEVSLLSSHLAYPQEGHLEAALHVMAYLRAKHNSRLVFDPTYPDIDQYSFHKCDWNEFYGDVTEALLPDAPEPLGKDVDIRMMVDSDHAGDKKTRRSRTGFLIFVNNAIVDWISKKAADDRILSLRRRICCYEAWDGKAEGTTLQDTHDGRASDRAILHLR
jgi:hypothetical protein